VEVFRSGRIAGSRYLKSRGKDLGLEG